MAIIPATGLRAFTFCSSELRVIEKDSEPWFVAKDVADILDLSDVSMMCSKLRAKDKDTSKASTLGGDQNLTIISESALYRITLRSNKPQAEPFQYWICDEVLPTIRKTGKFIAHPEFDLSILDREVDINQRYKASVLALREAKIQDNQRKLDRFRVKIKFVAPVEFNKSIVAWVDRYLAYCEGSILYIGIAGKKANTLSTSYAAFCIRNDFEILGQQRFSSELIKYLSHGKQWQINKQPRDSTGTCILNIAFA